MPIQSPRLTVASSVATWTSSLHDAGSTKAACHDTSRHSSGNRSPTAIRVYFTTTRWPSALCAASEFDNDATAPKVAMPPSIRSGGPSSTIRP
jgi:hypothetical protein